MTALLAASAATAAAAAPGAEDVARATAETLRAIDLQLELPREPEPLGWHIALPPELLWATVILGALLLLYFFIQELPGLRLARRGAAWDGSAGAGESAPPPGETAAIAADELARQGRFAEAMHVLLLEALAELRRRSGEPFADSLTSREILRRVRLPERGAASLGDIVGRVERSHFGEHPAGLADYEGCRASFDALGRALAGGAGA